MSDKTFKIVGNDISDGYHTFSELYQHRNLLFLTWLVEEKKYARLDRQVYYVEDHFPHWDLVATNIGREQVSYHVPDYYRNILEKYFIRKDTLEDVFDGHDSAEVAGRLYRRLVEEL